MLQRAYDAAKEHVAIHASLEPAKLRRRGRHAATLRQIGTQCDLIVRLMGDALKRATTSRMPVEIKGLFATFTGHLVYEAYVLAARAFLREDWPAFNTHVGKLHERVETLRADAYTETQTILDFIENKAGLANMQKLLGRVKDRAQEVIEQDRGEALPLQREADAVHHELGSDDEAHTDDEAGNRRDPAPPAARPEGKTAPRGFTLFEADTPARQPPAGRGKAPPAARTALTRDDEGGADTHRRQPPPAGRQTEASVRWRDQNDVSKLNEAELHLYDALLGAHKALGLFTTTMGVIRDNPLLGHLAVAYIVKIAIRAGISGRSAPTSLQAYLSYGLVIFNDPTLDTVFWNFVMERKHACIDHPVLVWRLNQYRSVVNPTGALADYGHLHRTLKSGQKVGNATTEAGMRRVLADLTAVWLTAVCPVKMRVCDWTWLLLEDEGAADLSTVRKGGNRMLEKRLAVEMAERVVYAVDEVREFVDEQVSSDLCCGNTFSDAIEFADELAAVRRANAEAREEPRGRQRPPPQARKAMKKEPAAA